jgi:hypothetical protein
MSVSHELNSWVTNATTQSSNSSCKRPVRLPTTTHAEVREVVTVVTVSGYVTELPLIKARALLCRSEFMLIRVVTAEQSLPEGGGPEQAQPLSFEAELAINSRRPNRWPSGSGE